MSRAVAATTAGAERCRPSLGRNLYARYLSRFKDLRFRQSFVISEIYLKNDQKFV
jgi:hypothetical protein